METFKQNNYIGRLELLPRLGCQVDGEAVVKRLEIRNGLQWVLLCDCDILGDYVDHLRVKNKQPVGNGDKVKFKGKVYMYNRNTKVGLTNVLLKF